jgi:competence protein ComEC
MVVVVALALCLDRLGSATRVLSVALLAVLLLDPWAVLSPGFWLSFGAVGLIFYVVAGRWRVPGHHWPHGQDARGRRQSRLDGVSLGPRAFETLKRWGAVQWAMTVGLAPLLLALFGQVSLASPLANAVAIPVVSFVVTPLALLGAVLPASLPADGLLNLAHAAFALLMPLLEALAGAESAVWQQHAPEPWSVPLALLGALWLLAPRGVPARALGLVLMLPLFALAPAGPQRGELWLTVLDVGQGLAVLARTQNHALLYDAGPAWSGQADSGSRIVLPYLRGEGIGRLDVLVISHEDKDHAGGAASVLAGLPVAQQLSSAPPSRLPDSRTAYRLPCTAGRHWEWDEVRFEWLHPAPGALPARSTNEVSCVLRMTGIGGSVLLAGDIERGAEQALLRSGASSRAEVLVVPHHGSGTSSTPQFVAAVAPRHAVFAVGYRNRFGHPKHEVWERYDLAQRHRSDRDGAVTFRMGARGIAVEHEREQRRRYWQGR